jgi:hypothetical protein
MTCRTGPLFVFCVGLCGCSSDGPGATPGGTGGVAGASIGGAGATGGARAAEGGHATGGGGSSTGGTSPSGPGGGTASSGSAAQGGSGGSGGAAGAGGAGNGLARVPWEGGPAYWEKFPAAVAAGWTDPSFYPLGVWFEAVDNWSRLKDVGINLYVGANHSSVDIQAFKDLGGDEGVFFIMNDEWSTADYGGNSKLVVGGLASDEIDMLSDNPVPEQRASVEGFRSRNDGRFVYANYGKGALGTFWNAESMPALVQMVDVASDDLYFFTDPNLPGEAPNSPAWPQDARVRQAASYGWTMERMKGFLLASELHPTWNFVEYSYPWSEPEPADGSKSMTADKLGGAVWASIIHEARGVVLFNHAFGGAQCGGQHTILDCSPEMRDRLKTLFGNVRSVAPVLNSQSYVWDAAAGVDTMLKEHGGAFYLFAQLGHAGTTGSNTLSLPGGHSGKVEVLFEGRSLEAVAGKLTDTFPDTNVAHVYKFAH